MHKSRGIYGKLVVLDGAGEEIKVDVLSEGQDVAGVHALIRHGVDELEIDHNGGCSDLLDAVFILRCIRRDDAADV